MTHLLVNFKQGRLQIDVLGLLALFNGSVDYYRQLLLHFFSKKSQIDSNKHYLCFVLFFISSNCTDNHFVLASICVILHPAFGTKENLFCLCKLKLLVGHHPMQIRVFWFFYLPRLVVHRTLHFNQNHLQCKMLSIMQDIILHPKTSGDHVEKESRAYK